MFMSGSFELLLLILQGIVTLIPPMIPDVNASGVEYCRELIPCGSFGTFPYTV